MRVTWEVDDIRGGRRVVRRGTSEVYIISYTGSDNAYCLTSLVDGLVLPARTKAALADMLNQHDYIPEEMSGSVYFLGVSESYVTKTDEPKKATEPEKRKSLLILDCSDIAVAQLYSTSSEIDLGILNRNDWLEKGWSNHRIDKALARMLNHNSMVGAGSQWFDVPLRDPKRR